MSIILTSSKTLAAGISTVGVSGSGVGIGIIFGAFFWLLQNTLF